MGRRCPVSSRDIVLFEMPVASATPVRVIRALRAESLEPGPDLVERGGDVAPLRCPPRRLI